MCPEIFKTMLEIAEGGTTSLQADFFQSGCICTYIKK